MFKNNNIQEQTNLVLVPVQLVDEIKQLLNEIRGKQTTDTKTDSILGEFISEKEARKLLGRKTTWFYEQRRSGRLPYSKVGSKVFYKTKDIHALISVSYE
jgi:hypothetical protein